jgi:hypothetical protein
MCNITPVPDPLVAHQSTSCLAALLIVHPVPDPLAAHQLASGLSHGHIGHKRRAYHPESARRLPRQVIKHTEHHADWDGLCTIQTRGLAMTISTNTEHRSDILVPDDRHGKDSCPRKNRNTRITQPTIVSEHGVILQE